MDIKGDKHKLYLLPWTVVFHKTYCEEDRQK